MRMCVLYCSLAVLLVCVLSPFQDHKLAQYDEVEFSVQNVSTLMCTSLHIYIGKKVSLCTSYRGDLGPDRYIHVSIFSRPFFKSGH